MGKGLTHPVPLERGDNFSIEYEECPNSVAPAAEPTKNRKHCNKRATIMTGHGVSNKAESANYSEWMRRQEAETVEIPFFDSICTYILYAIVMVVGMANDALRPINTKEKHRKDYIPLYVSFESFYTRNAYRRVRDCWNTPICSVPGERCTVLERITRDRGWTFELTGEKIDCINMGSYNYLGFASNTGPCTEAAVKAIQAHGIHASVKSEMGNTRYLQELERTVARFVGAEDSLVCAMGFATNALNLPGILNSSCLVISDEMNHASIILGLKTSGAKTSVFKHNDMDDLESKLWDAVKNGRPKTGVPWEKLFIVVEGVYSMEGTITNLPMILHLKKKYKAYVYVDEAHSIGAVGPKGRGVCDYWGISPKEVDILMGTFTKSFGSAGGYIAGSADVIRVLRANSFSRAYGSVIPGPIAAQVAQSMRIIMGEDGTTDGVQRVGKLLRNTRYFRQRLKQLRFIVYGSEDSPVVPVAVTVTTKVIYCVREMKKMGVAIVPVGFPATALLGGKIRFCLSAAHTKEMLDYVLDTFARVGDDLYLRTSKVPVTSTEVVY